MRLYPAIDILDGTAVRLVKGDFDARQTYASDPLTAAAAWAQAGAEALHVVDLDGARSGEPVNLDHLAPDRLASWGCRSSTAAACVPGTRSTAALAAGATRVILGTAALRDPAAAA